MEKLSLARECGLRCRRIRMAKNMSQQDLADLLFTTPQNISKYEKDGISNIDTIKRISDVLGQDLLTDETDVEGAVGEIGKEILHALIDNEGFMDVSRLIEDKMYGMSMDRISHEIFKLERIGMCVREQYVNWVVTEKDMLFITAKGVITYKNCMTNSLLLGELYNKLGLVKTYESLFEETGNYQEYMDSRPGEKLIRSIGYPCVSGHLGSDKYLLMQSAYRANYVEYLKRNFETGIDASWDVIRSMAVPGVSCYHDILYRMSLNVTNDVLWMHILSGDEYFDLEDEYDTLTEELSRSDNDPVIVDTISSFKSEFPWTEEEEDDSDDEKEPDESSEKTEKGHIKPKWLSDEEFAQKEKRLEELEDYMYDTYTYSYELNLELIYNRNRPKDASKYPTDWYTVDEIKDFINKNFGPAETEQEKELDRVLKKINELIPETLDYYTFPEEWEKNGLADLVRKNVGITKE